MANYPPPFTPYEEQLLAELQAKDLLLERLKAGTIECSSPATPEAHCRFCGSTVRFRCIYNTSANLLHLECPDCKGPHRLPEPVFSSDQPADTLGLSQQSAIERAGGQVPAVRPGGP